jgi:hypothetical protein
MKPPQYYDERLKILKQIDLKQIVSNKDYVNVRYQYKKDDDRKRLEFV